MKSTWISLDIDSLFFHTVHEPVQALVMMYDEIFQGLAIGNVLLSNPFLDPTLLPQLVPLGLPRIWETEETSPRPAIYI
jgi:hypothetical protein